MSALNFVIMLRWCVVNVLMFTWARIMVTVWFVCFFFFNCSENNLNTKIKLWISPVFLFGGKDTVKIPILYLPRAPCVWVTLLLHMYCTQHLQCEHLEVLWTKAGQLCPEPEVDNSLRASQDRESTVASPTSELLLICMQHKRLPWQ